MIHVDGSYLFPAPPEDVWPILMTAASWAESAPGCESLNQFNAQQYQGVQHIAFGPLKGRYVGTVTLLDIEPIHQYGLTVNAGGATGSLAGSGLVQLEEQDGQTLLRYQGDVEVSGRLAELPPRLLQSSARAVIRQSLYGIEYILKGRPIPQFDEDTHSHAFPLNVQVRWLAAVGLILLSLLILARWKRGNSAED